MSSGEEGGEKRVVRCAAEVWPLAAWRVFDDVASRRSVLGAGSVGCSVRVLDARARCACSLCVLAARARCARAASSAGAKKKAAASTLGCNSRLAENGRDDDDDDGRV